MKQDQPNTILQRLPIVILAGGRSERLSSTAAPKKWMLPFGETNLLHHIHKRAQTFRPATIAINLPRDEQQHPDLPQAQYLADTVHIDKGPLCGVYTALEWAQTSEYSHVLTLPCDTPFFPIGVFDQLAHALNQNPTLDAVTVSDPNRDHPLFALWSVNLLERLDTFLRSEAKKSVFSWLNQCHHNAVKFISQEHTLPPFFNINHQDDYQLALQQLLD